MKPKRSLRAFLLASGTLIAVSYTQAATLYWDGTDITANADGGAGIWNTSNTNWDTLAMGGANATWSNVTPDSAVFGGVASPLVSLGSNISVGGLTFNTTGYTISTGANTLSFENAPSTSTSNIVFNNIAAATITGTIAGSGNVVLSTTNPATAGTLTLNGTSTTGWSGTTTINAGMTLALAGSNQALTSTTGGITLNGGGITLTNTTTAEGGLDRVSNSTITANSGTITYNNTVSGNTYAESLGTVALNRGQLNFVQTTNMAAGSQTLTLADLTHTGATNTSTVTFSSATALDATRNIIRNTNFGSATPANQIIAPWATTGTAAGTQTRWAVYDGSGNILPDSIADTAEGSWVDSTTNAWSIQPGTSNTTANHIAAATKVYGGAGTWTLNNFNLQTGGIFFSGANAMVIAGSGANGVITALPGGGNLYVTMGQQNHTINAPINNPISGGGTTTLVVSGAGRQITLGSTTSNFSGGIVLNSGQLNTSADSNLGIGGGITVNGPASWNIGGSPTYNRAITINDGGVLSLPNGSVNAIITGILSGNGAIAVTGSGQYQFTNPGNNFTGTITTGYGMHFASLGDSSNPINVSNASVGFNWTGGAKTFASRPFTLNATGTGIIQNGGTGALVIQQPLGISGAAGARTLTLQGANANANTFSGAIADGTDGGISLVGVSKAGNGTWVLSNTANSYTGVTSVSAGTLQLGASDVLSSGNVTVTGGTLQLGTFSDTVGVVTITGGAIDGSSGVLSGSRVAATGTSTISAILGGSGSLSRAGAGSTTSLTKANTYSGGTNVVGGTLAVGASGTLGQNVVGNGISIRDQGILTLAAAANSGSNQAITLTSSSWSGGTVGNLAVLGLGFNGLPTGSIAQANTNGGVIAINGVTGYNTDLSSTLSGKNLFLGAIGTSTFTGAAGTVVAGNDSLYRLGGGGGQITFNTTNLFTGANGVQAGSHFTNGGGTVVVSATQDYSGATTVRAGTLTLSGASGTATGSSGFTLNGGRLFLDSSGTGNNNANRIGTGAIAIRYGGELSLNGNASGTAEGIGSVSIGAGLSTVTVAATTANSSLAGLGFTRTDNGTGLIRGTSLGQNVAAPMAQYTLSNTSGLSFVGASTLDNAPSTDTTKDVKIIPYLVGGTTGTDNGSTFVTYDDTLGFRALNTTNHFNTSVVAGTNVRFGSAQTGIATNSINSLIVAHAGPHTINSGNTLTIASGALLFSATGAINPASGTATIEFGTAQGVITTAANGTISTIISGSSGVIKSGTGTLTLSGANNFTGGFTINGGNVTMGTAAVDSLGASGSTVTVNASTTLTYGGNTTFNKSFVLNNGAILNHTNGNNAGTITGAVTGTGGVGPQNAGGIEQRTLSLTSTANTFTGPIMLNWDSGNNSTIAVNSLSDAAGSGTINMFANASGEFMWGGASSGAPIAPLVLNNRQFQISGGTNLIIKSGSSAGNFGMTINTDLLVTGVGAKTLTLRNSSTATNTFAGQIVDGPAVVGVTRDSDTGLWVLSNTGNTYTGATNISAGTLQIASLANGGSASSIGASSNVAANLILNGGTLRYTGGAVSTDRLFSLQASSTLNASGSGAVNFTNTGLMGFNGGTAAKTLTLTGTNTGNNTIAAAIGDNTGATAITKTGIGTWVLSGANTNTGATNISGGGALTLDYSTQNNSKIGTGGVLTLGSGTVGVGGGTLTINSGLSSFAQNVGSTTVSGGGTFINRTGGSNTTINLGTTTFGTTGTVSFAADGIATTNTTNTQGILSPNAVVGNDWAVNSTNAANGPIVALTSYNTSFPQTGGTNTVNYSLTGGQIQSGTTTPQTLKIIASANNQTLALGVNNVNLTSVGGVSGMIFTAGGSGYTYNITGSGTIKSATANNALALFVNDGILNVSAVVNAGSALTNKSGAGTLILNTARTDSNNNWSINQGVVRLTNGGALGANAAAQTTGVQNGAALELDNNITAATRILAITGNGISNGGALRNITSVTTNNAPTYPGAITIGTGGARINSDSGGLLTLTGGVTTSQFNDVTFGGAGNTTVQTTGIIGAGGLTKDGAGTTTLTATNTYTGATFVNGGTLNVGAGGVAANINTTSGITVAGGAKLAYNSSTALTVAPILNGTGTGAGQRAILGGTGTINAAVTLDNTGDTLSPGNSPGIQNYAASQSWSSFSYDWELNNFSATPVAGTNFDQLGINGQLTLGGSPGSYVLNLLSLDGLNASGAVVGFAEENRTWTIATTATGLTGFNSGNWTINDSSFKTTNGALGNFTLSNDTNNIFLTYTAVPEPNVAALLGGLGALLLLRRKR